MPKLISCDKNGVCTIDAMPLISQEDPLIADSPYGKGITADCYDASICSLVVTVLADRDESALPSPPRRTATFDGIPATQPTPKDSQGIPKVLNQLAWQTRTAGTAEAFYFPEVLADFGPVYQSTPDPRVYDGSAPVLFTSGHGATFRDWTTKSTQHITNEYIEALLDVDVAVMLGFHWAAPSSVQGQDGQWRVEFSLPGTHKVVISGYRPGAYPLQINHIYDAGQSWARLLPLDQTTRLFGSPPLTSQAIDYSTLADVPTSFCLDFEEDSAETQVRLVTQIDAVSLNWRPPQRTVSLRWGAGWTSFMPFEMTGAPHQVAYNETSGEVHVDELFANGAQTLWSGQWASGWTHFVPFTHDGAPHQIAYNAANGLVHIDLLRSDFRGVDGRWSGTWEAGFTHLSPFTLDGEPHFIAYNANSGLVHFDRINDNLQGSTTRFEANWASGWTSLMTFSRDGQPGFIVYRSSTGAVQFCRIGHQGALGGTGVGDDLFLDILRSGTWGAGWTSLISLPSAGVPHYFACNAGTGDVHFDRLALDGSGSSSLWEGTTSKGFTSGAAFVRDGEYYVLLYDQGTGEFACMSATPL